MTLLRHRIRDLALAALTAFLVVAPAAALPVLSEVLYDAVGSDDGFVFVELYGEPGSSVEGFAIEGINGSGGSTTISVPLTGTIPADGVLVVADAGSEGISFVAEADLVLDFDFQNGPDSVLLLDDLGEVIDAVGYGVFEADHVFAGESCPVPDAPAGASIARVFANVDTDENGIDWDVLAVPTPGQVDLLAVPEPAPTLLFGVGLAALAAAGRRRR
jgi:hypothetical protein